MTSNQDETDETDLAGKKYKISALTLDQLQEILPALDRLRLAPDVGARIKEARIVICSATGVENTELGKMTISLNELLAAVQAICKLTGLEELGKKAAATAS